MFQQYGNARYNEGLVPSLRRLGNPVLMFRQEPWTYALLKTLRLNVNAVPHILKQETLHFRLLDSFEVLHLNDAVGPELALPALRKRKRLVVTVHGYLNPYLDPVTGETKAVYDSLKEKVEYRSRVMTIRELYRLGARIVAGSNYERGAISRATGATSRVVSLGVDTTLFSPSSRSDYLRKILGIRESDDLVLWIGRGHGLKDPFTFVRCIPRVVHERKNTLFVMVFGHQGPLFNSILRLGRQLGVLGGALRIVERVPPQDAPRLYWSSNIYVSTSPYESWGMTISEAMASGLPVIVADRGGPTEFVEDAGLTFRSGDSGDLSESILRVLSDKPLAQRLGRGGVRIARARLTWERSAKEYQQIYAS